MAYAIATLISGRFFFHNRMFFFIFISTKNNTVKYKNHVFFFACFFFSISSSGIPVFFLLVAHGVLFSERLVSVGWDWDEQNSRFRNLDSRNFTVFIDPYSEIRILETANFRYTKLLYFPDKVLLTLIMISGFSIEYT